MTMLLRVPNSRYTPCTPRSRLVEARAAPAIWQRGTAPIGLAGGLQPEVGVHHLTTGLLPAPGRAHRRPELDVIALEGPSQNVVKEGLKAQTRTNLSVLLSQYAKGLDRASLPVELVGTWPAPGERRGDHVPLWEWVACWAGLKRIKGNPLPILGLLI